MAKKSLTTKQTKDEPGLTKEGLAKIFQSTYSDLALAIKKEVDQINSGDRPVTASNVQAVVKFLELTQDVMADKQRAGILPQAETSYGKFPVSNDDDYGTETAAINLSTDE